MITSTTTNGGAQPSSAPAFDTSKWELRDWIKQLHGANRVLAQNPNDQGAQDAVNNAWAYLGQQQQTGAQADIKEAGQLAPGIAGDALAGVVGFGRGASLGATRLFTDKGSLDAISAAHPKSTLIGDVLGTGATSVLGGAGLAAAKIPAAYAGATLLGGTGAVRGAFDPMLTGDRVFDSILGGLGGIVGGAIAGKIGAKVVAPIWRTLAPAVRNTGMKMAAYFGSRGMNASEAEEATVSKLRQYLTSLPEASRPTNEQIERQLETVRADFRKAVPVRPLAANHEAPPTPRTVQDELATPVHLTIPRGEDLRATKGAQEALAPLTGSEGRGFEVTGTRATPPIPTEPTLLEMQQGITKQGMARAASEVPPSNPGAILRGIEARKGSPLTAEERDRVLQNLLGKKGSRPGHPIWYGGGTFTP